MALCNDLTMEKHCLAMKYYGLDRSFLGGSLKKSGFALQSLTLLSVTVILYIFNNSSFLSKYYQEFFFCCLSCHLLPPNNILFILHFSHTVASLTKSILCFYLKGDNSTVMNDHTLKSHSKTLLHFWLNHCDN